MALENRLRIALKKLIAKNGLTYAELADRMRVSESSVKRMMTTKTIKIEEFENCCKCLNTSPYEAFLFAFQDGQAFDELTYEQEDFLCRNPTLDYIFLKLAIGFSREAIEEQLDLLPAKMQSYLKKIERYGLVRLTNNGLVVMKRGPFKWVKNGPFEKNFGKSFPKYALKRALDLVDKENENFFLKSFEIYLTSEGNELLIRDIEDLIEEHKKKARLELSVQGLKQMKPYSFVVAIEQIELWNAIYRDRSGQQSE